MLTASLVLVSFILGMTYNKITSKHMDMFILLISAVITNLTENRLKITETKCNNSTVINYSNMTLNTFESKYHYDIRCYEFENSLEEENHSHILRENKNDKKYPINVFRYKNFLCYNSFKPEDLNCKTLYVCIRRINFQEYSIYKFNENDFINIKDIVNRYETYLETPKEIDLAEAYD